MKLSVRVEIEVESSDPHIGQRLADVAASALSADPRVGGILHAASVTRRD